MMIRRLLSCLVLVRAISIGLAAEANPHILLNENDKFRVLDKIGQQTWASARCNEMSSSGYPYMERHKSDPEWILSRYQMKRIPGKRHIQATYDRAETNLIDRTGDAPVPTVRVSHHMRSPVTMSGRSYARPEPEDIIPYDTSKLMDLMSLVTRITELIDHQALIGDINDKSRISLYLGAGYEISCRGYSITTNDSKDSASVTIDGKNLKVSCNQMTIISFPSAAPKKLSMVICETKTKLPAERSVKGISLTVPAVNNAVIILKK